MIESKPLNFPEENVVVLGITNLYTTAIEWLFSWLVSMFSSIVSMIIIVVTNTTTTITLEKTLCSEIQNEMPVFRYWGVCEGNWAASRLDSTETLPRSHSSKLLWWPCKSCIFIFVISALEGWNFYFLQWESELQAFSRFESDFEPNWLQIQISKSKLHFHI